MREQWVAKHSVPLRVYQVDCPVCSVKYELDSAVPLKELHCPFCENEEPLRVVEITGENSGRKV